MRYEVVLEKGNYALIVHGKNLQEYAVVNGLNKEKGCWDWTCAYYNFGVYSRIDQTEALFLALDYFRSKTETDYISYDRVTELATLFKDGLIEDDKETAMEYFENQCDMDEKEMKYFGLLETETTYEVKYLSNDTQSTIDIIANSKEEAKIKFFQITGKEPWEIYSITESEEE